jgi:hypothetical protein
VTRSHDLRETIPTVYFKGLKIYLKANFKIIFYKYLAIKKDFITVFNYFNNIKLYISLIYYIKNI